MSVAEATRRLAPSQLVSLEIFAPSGSLNARGWVIQVGSSVRVELEKPPTFGQEMLGTSVQVGCADEFGLYYGHAPLAAIEAGPPAQLVLGQVPELRHVQRREHFRVDAELPITYSLTNAEAAADQRQARTTNLSGGGLLFLTEGDAAEAERLRERGRVWIDIAISASSRILSEAEIVRMNVVRALRQSGTATVAAKFVGLSERERDKLIRYLFEVQRTERRRRGLF